MRWIEIKDRLPKSEDKAVVVFPFNDKVDIVHVHDLLDSSGKDLSIKYWLELSEIDMIDIKDQMPDEDNFIVLYETGSLEFIKEYQWDRKTLKNFNDVKILYWMKIPDQP
jgi:hypothetical protein